MSARGIRRSPHISGKISRMTPRMLLRFTITMRGAAKAFPAPRSIKPSPIPLAERKREVHTRTRDSGGVHYVHRVSHACVLREIPRHEKHASQYHHHHHHNRPPEKKVKIKGRLISRDSPLSRRIDRLFFAARKRGMEEMLEKNGRSRCRKKSDICR